MKNKVWIIIAAVFVAVMAAAAALYPKLAEKYSGDGAPEGTVSPGAVQAVDFTVYDQEMKEIKLSDKLGKPVVINFWASWCSPCKSELPAFNAMYEEYKDEVEFLMINLTDGQADTVESVREFVSGYSFPVYYDIEYDASAAYGVRSIPETVFIRADGSVYDIRIGAMSEVALKECIEELLEGGE